MPSLLLLKGGTYKDAEPRHVGPGAKWKEVTNACNAWAISERHNVRSAYIIGMVKFPMLFYIIGEENVFFKSGV